MAYAAPVDRPGLIGNGIKSTGDGNRVIMSRKIMPSVKRLFCAIRGELRIKLPQRIIHKTLHEIRRRKSVIAVELSWHCCEIIVQGSVVGGLKSIAGKREDLKRRVIAKIWSYAGRCISQNIR